MAKAQPIDYTAPMLRAKAVAHYLGISKSTLYAWLKAGRIPTPVKVGPGAVAWRRSELDEFLSDCENGIA